MKIHYKQNIVIDGSFQNRICRENSVNHYNYSIKKRKEFWANIQ